MATAPFREALRARTPWAVVTPTIVALNLAVFLVMRFGDGALGAPADAGGWGGSLGPLTTNGEWWRVVTACSFTRACCICSPPSQVSSQLGRMLERLVGPFMFAAVFMSAGCSRTWRASPKLPLVVRTGATGGIFGIYGLLLAVTTWGLLRRTGVRVPLMAFRSLAPTAASSCCTAS